MSRTGELLELTRVRVVLFLREPEAVFWVFFFPVIMAVVLGFAFRDSEVGPSKIGVVAAGGDAAAVIAALKGASDLEVEVFDDAGEARHKLERGGLEVMVVPTDPPELHFDTARADAETARLRVEVALRINATPRAPPVMSKVKVTGIGSRYIDFLFAGLIGMNIMGTGIWGVGFGVVDQRQKKLLKRLLVTPMRRSSFLLSFVLSRLIFLIMEMVVLLLFGLLVLDVPLEGPVAGFFLFCIAGALCFSGLGLLIASRARTIEGISGIMNFTMMPMWLCSGVFFSYERFPEAVQPICRAIPLTALNDALRAIMLDGEGIGGSLLELGIILAWGVACFAIALKIFRWE